MASSSRINRSSYCVVSGCSNNDYKLGKWEKEICGVHPGTLHVVCCCLPPFTLFCFPHKRMNIARDSWQKLLNRESPTKEGKPLTLKPKMRICSKHFVDGEPTDAKACFSRPHFCRVESNCQLSSVKVRLTKVKLLKLFLNAAFSIRCSRICRTWCWLTLVGRTLAEFNCQNIDSL